ncbi:MAG: trehalose-6-phosphate synthase [Roseovarius sp.]
MTERLIVISNRIPTDAVPSGGLVVALHEVLCKEGGVWIGAHPEPVETPGEEFVDVPAAHYQKKAFQLSEKEIRNYYLGYSNSFLWPLCHRRCDLARYRRAYAEDYLAVNARVARQVARLAGPDDLIWVHDYHFLPLAKMLREQGVSARIGLFLHIPFPVLADTAVLPDRDALRDWFAAYHLVGLQTRADVARCREFFRAEPAGKALFDGRVKYRDRSFSVRAFPIGIDVASFARLATSKDDGDRVNLGPREDLIIGVDRLDYSKGLSQRFRAFSMFLDQQQPGDRRASLLQIAPPSREDLKAYQDIREELARLSGSINGEYGGLDWTPICYIHRNVPRERLAGLYRSARVGLVTPLADGMNLVAKEYVAAQAPDDPGVLVLSRMAGAAEDMTAALLVNPHDVEHMARTIKTALTMPLEERKRRHRKLMATIKHNDISAWRRNYLRALREVQPASRAYSPPAGSLTGRRARPERAAPSHAAAGKQPVEKATR